MKAISEFDLYKGTERLEIIYKMVIDNFSCSGTMKQIHNVLL